ncbi:T9SS type A sorting domain-containing protein [Bacteroidota bacterium]
MKRDHTYENIERFYGQFKSLPGYFTLEQVQEIVANPVETPRIPGYSKNFFNTLNVFIMGTLIVSFTALLVFWIIPEKNKEQPAHTNTKNKVTTIAQENLKPETSTLQKSSADEKINRSTDHNMQKTNIPEISGELSSHTTNQIADTIIDGQKYIVELTNKELEKLGFYIRQHIVFYRNTYKNDNIFFSTFYEDVGIIVKEDSTSKRRIELIRENMPLQIDTFPEYAVFSSPEFRIDTTSEKNRRLIYNYYKNCSLDFYPLITSTLDREITSLNPDVNFESQNDTLVPVVLRFSRLNCQQKKDIIFWFTTSTDFFNALPIRYKWLKKEYNSLKRLKSTTNKNIVDYYLRQWKKSQLLPIDTIIDGRNFIIELTDDELAKIGMFRKENGWIEFSYHTPWRGTGRGGKLIYDKDRPYSAYTRYDTIFYVDYLPYHPTDTKGQFQKLHTSAQELDNFLIENDVLLPVKIKQEEKEEIIWFSLSETLWSLLPERYKPLQKEYQKIQFFKSYYPEKDIVIYFPEGQEKIEYSINPIELTKEELEKIGFTFSLEELIMQCIFNKEWLKYRNHMAKSIQNSKSKNPRYLQNPARYSFQTVQHLNHNSKYLNYDSVMQCEYKGYHFIYVTDTIGRYLNKFNSRSKQEFEKGQQFNYLIPILVDESALFVKGLDKKIFWFTPTDSFFNRLPDYIREDIKREYKSLIAINVDDAQPKTCTYFEECKSTLELSQFNIYPNPASTNLTIDFTSNQELEGKISLVTISGSVVKVLVQDQSFKTGINHFETDVSDVSPGIYLIYFATDKGFIIQRFVVSR